MGGVGEVKILFNIRYCQVSVQGKVLRVISEKIKLECMFYFNREKEVGQKKINKI